MQELKPVAVISIDFYKGYIGYRNQSPDLLVDLPEGHHTVYAIPDTHRIVPVELLERVHQFAAVAAEHYSGMNDEVCQSYSEPWQQGVALGKELKAIIDKENT